MILSDELLAFGQSNNPCFLSALLMARDYQPILTRCVYVDPNYGSCWFRAKFFPLGSAQEVALRAVKYTAQRVAIAANVYYDALLGLAKNAGKARKVGMEGNTAQGALFSYAFPPYQMVVSRETMPVGKKLKILFGTSQFEA